MSDATGRETATLSYADTSDKSTAELAGDLSRQLTKLVHQEISLAKAELAQKGKRAGIGGGMFGAAAVSALFAAFALTVAGIAALHIVVPVWLAALIVAGVYLFFAGAAAILGKRQVQLATPPVPEQAVESTKEDVEWLKTQVKSAVEIEETREELAGTVQGLAAKADVKQRARDSIHENTAKLHDKASEIQGKVTDLGDRVRDAAPDKAKASTTLVRTRIQQDPWLAAIPAGVALLAVYAKVRRRRKS